MRHAKKQWRPGPPCGSWLQRQRSGHEYKQCVFVVFLWFSFAPFSQSPHTISPTGQHHVLHIIYVLCEAQRHNFPFALAGLGWGRSGCRKSNGHIQKNYTQCIAITGRPRSQAKFRRGSWPSPAGLDCGWPGWAPPGWPNGPLPAGQRAQNISPTLVSTLVLTLVFIVRFAYSCPQF